MAKMASETIVITVSKLVKNSDEETTIMTDDTVSALEQVLGELIGNNSMIEIDRL